MKNEKLVELLNPFQSMQLDQMVSVRLINRTGTEFTTTTQNFPFIFTQILIKWQLNL